MTPRPPLDELLALFRATVATEGITTGAGDVAGDSFIDVALIGAGDNSFVSMLAILYPGDPRQVDSKDIIAFDTAIGEVTLASPYKGAPGAIPAGVPYKIVTFRFVPAEVAAIDAKIGTAADNADLGTLFAKHFRQYLGTHTHALVVVHDTSDLDADLDTALQQWLLDVGFIVTLADPTDVAGELEVGSFDLVMVSASCVAPGDVANLANLNRVGAPVICHSADIAASVVFDLGATPHTHAAQTEIEITDNTVMYLITQALGDLVVTASANIYAMNTITAASVELAQVDSHVDDHITALRLSAGEENEAGYAAFYDRYFVGVGDYTNMNAAWKAVMAELVMHCVMEKRFTEEAVVQVKGVYQEDVPDTPISISPDDTLSNNPPIADAANSVVDIDKKQNRTFVLRSLFINISDLGGGTETMTFKLWVDIGGTPTEVDSVDVTSTGYQNLMDLFGLPEVHADSIHITATVDAGTGTIAGIYRYAEAKK